MKPLNLLAGVVLWCASLPLCAQYYSTKDEVRTISEDIVGDLNFLPYTGRIVIFDFTDPSDTPTELGAFLADLMTDDLVNARRKFQVVSREAIEGKKRTVPWDKIMRTIEKGASTLEDSGTADDIGNAARASQDLFHPNPNDRRLKGVDAILKGDITVVGDHYNLSITVTDKKKGDILASASGDITNTIDLANLHGSTLQAPGRQGGEETTDGTSTSRNGSRANPNHRFVRQHLKFELIKCIENGSYVECHLRITSEGRDASIRMRRNWTKIFSQKDGKEFQPVSVNIADATNPWEVEKTIIKDSPATSILSFQPGERIDVLSRLSFVIHSPELGQLTIDMDDIFVE